MAIFILISALWLFLFLGFRYSNHTIGWLVSLLGLTLSLGFMTIISILQ